MFLVSGILTSLTFAAFNNTYICIYSKIYYTLVSIYICYASGDYRPQPYSGQVRLVGGEYPSEGALQIFYNGKWGGVYLGDHIEAKPDDFYAVACRQLGYTDMLSLDTINRTSR